MMRSWLTLLLHEQQPSSQIELRQATHHAHLTKNTKKCIILHRCTYSHDDLSPTSSLNSATQAAHNTLVQPQQANATCMTAGWLPQQTPFAALQSLLLLLVLLQEHWQNTQHRAMSSSQCPTPQQLTLMRGDSGQLLLLCPETSLLPVQMTC
jgi:hypothetical protein